MPDKSPNLSNGTLILVDGSNFLYRAFHGLPHLTNSAGEPTGAVYGMVNMLRRLLGEYAPSHIAVVFDARGESFRSKLYPEYKAHRPPMPDELSRQIPVIHEVIRALGLPILAVEDVEADDVIATLAEQARARGMRTLIASGDKDLTQIVSDDIRMLDTMKGVTYDPAGVQAKYGVPPERIVDYLTLVGDASDNVPGVPKVGPKTAVSWLAQYGSLDEIVARASEFEGKLGENLRSSLATLPLSRALVTLKRDVALDRGPQDLCIGARDNDTLRELFGRLEFKSWLAELGGTRAAAESAAQAHYEMVLDEARLNAWLKRLRDAGAFAFDTETTSLDAMKAELVGVSFSLEPGAAAYVPLAHDYPGAPEQLSRTSVLDKLRPLLEDPALPKIGQNLKYDCSVLARHGVEMQGMAYDTMLESYVLDSVANRHDMDTLSLKYLGHKTISFEEVAGKGKNQIGFNQVDLDTATRYAAEDAEVTLRLHRLFWPRLEAEPGLKTLFETIEMPLVPVLSRMERTGVRVDTAMLKQQSAELTQRIGELDQQACRAAGSVFNLASPRQIQEILFERLKMPVLRKTPTGQPSTAEDALEELAVQYELPRLILEHRALAKLKSTYTDKLPEMINPATGRVHTSYQQAVAATGRLSSSDPNLQNIPIRTPEGRRIRDAFVAGEGDRILAADYSQIELRIMAHLSGDENLLRAFARGEDIHRATAAEVFGVAPAQVNDLQRRHAKAINFGLIYGMSAFGLARQLRIEREAAQQYINRYFDRYPDVKRYMEATRAAARARGFVETLFGRRLYLPEIKVANQQRRQAAERTAINAPMQGTAADLIKLAMIAVDHWVRREAPHVRMIMQVHDELVFEVPAADAQAAGRKIVELMSGVAQLAVPLLVDVGIGSHWGEAHS
jgi:DNA polymerase-1